SSPSRATSACATTPTRRPLSTTGSLRTWCFAISCRASARSRSGSIVTISVEAISRTGVACGSFPSATSRIAMSRSVTVPNRFPFSITGIIPASACFISLAASAAGRSAWIVSGPGVITSRMCLPIVRPPFLGIGSHARWPANWRDEAVCGRARPRRGARRWPPCCRTARACRADRRARDPRALPVRGRKLRELLHERADQALVPARQAGARRRARGRHDRRADRLRRGARATGSASRAAALVRLGNVLVLALFRVWRGRFVQLVVAVVFPRRGSILSRHGGRPTRRREARTSGWRDGARRGACDRAEARRASGPRPLEWRSARPPPAAARRRADPDPDHARQGRPGRPLRAAALDRAPARRGRAAPVPGGEDRDRPADRERLLLRLRVSRADPRGRPRADRGRDRPRAEGGARVDARGGLPRGGEEALRRRAVQGRARRRGRGRHLAVHARRLHRPLPRAAPAELGADQGGQAHRPRRRILARRRAQHTADPDLRRRLLYAGRSRRAPRGTRGGAAPRPPPARTAARPVPLRRALARLAVLAPKGDGDLERDRAHPPPRERQTRLPGSAHAADLRQSPLGHLGPLGEVPREHVPDPARGRADLRDQADELPGTHAPLRARPALIPRLADPLRRGGAAPPQRARRG